MKIVIKGVRCNISEKTAVKVLYPQYPWCKTLAQAQAEETAERKAQESLDSITDYDVYSDVYKSVHGIRPRWLSREEFAKGRRA